MTVGLNSTKVSHESETYDSLWTFTVNLRLVVFHGTCCSELRCKKTKKQKPKLKNMRQFFFKLSADCAL